MSGCGFSVQSTYHVLYQVCILVGQPDAVINLRLSSCHSPFHLVD